MNWAVILVLHLALLIHTWIRVTVAVLYSVDTRELDSTCRLGSPSSASGHKPQCTEIYRLYIYIPGNRYILYMVRESGGRFTYHILGRNMLRRFLGTQE